MYESRPNGVWRHEAHVRKCEPRRRLTRAVCIWIESIMAVLLAVAAGLVLVWRVRGFR